MRCGFSFFLLSFFFFFLLFFLAYSQRSEIGCLPCFYTWCGPSANLECITKLCTMFGRLLGCYAIYTFWGLFPDRILPGAKFTLRTSLAFAYIGSVTARHSSSQTLRRRTKNGITELSHLGRLHLYSAGWPSRWPSAHILVLAVLKCLTKESEQTAVFFFDVSVAHQNHCHTE